MDDRDIQALLEKYRPAEAPAELQASIHRLTNSIYQPTNLPIHQLTWPWAVTAAALLVVAIGLHGRATAPTVHTAAPTVSELAEGLGGGPAAAAAADFILSSPFTAAGRDLDLSPANP